MLLTQLQVIIISLLDTFRPFAGLVAGIYSVAVQILKMTKPAMCQPVKTLVLCREPVLKLVTSARLSSTTLLVRRATINNNYLGIKLGFFIGGGRIDSNHPELRF